MREAKIRTSVRSRDFWVRQETSARASSDISPESVCDVDQMLPVPLDRAHEHFRNPVGLERQRNDDAEVVTPCSAKCPEQVGVAVFVDSKQISVRIDDVEGANALRKPPMRTPEYTDPAAQS